MKISAINRVQNVVLVNRDSGDNCSTCSFFSNSYKERYHKLLEFYYTGKQKFAVYKTLHYMYFDRSFYILDDNEMDQITYYRLFMLEIFKDVVRNGKI